ncbi:M20 aminoacylase family protein [Pseudomonas matsuisoli]|uniref:Hippurate hydrolase n=1 Tax=Pseudomonas matsuisoli TaxID=1515666 RepID=A0A917URD9_9PSED|nr:M20 aminoacylase family protein [Pseudomonas matsuisoli]GGJ78870.1 hippurate hydrolase [Pseudomonas matsuisoli]
MTNLALIDSYFEELCTIRHDIHAHPEIGFEETRTASLVARLLGEYGVDEVHTGIGGTGVVGLVHGSLGPGGRVGLRADMDALPMDEGTGLSFTSRNPGRFHGCGHDGHTTILLGAARYLAETRNFAGTAVLVFQPAEEGLGGARRMIAEGLFERFPMDEIYGMHNSPQHAEGEVAIFPGAAMAGADFFDITVKGRGSHGAAPHHSRDPVIVCGALIQALQSIVSRNVNPFEPAVLSITQVHAGSAYNVIPQTATLAGTVRMFSDAVRTQMRERMQAVVAGVAATFDVQIDIDIRDIFTVLDNAEGPARELEAVAREIVGDAKVNTTVKPVTGSEDFADMLKQVPGAYCRVGHSGNVPLHNPAFVLGDEILPLGASLFARIVERRLAPRA